MFAASALRVRKPAQSWLGQNTCQTNAEVDIQWLMELTSRRLQGQAPPERHSRALPALGRGVTKNGKERGGRGWAQPAQTDPPARSALHYKEQS